MSPKRPRTSEKLNDFPSYRPRDYPVGITDFLNTFPPERRKAVLAAVVDSHLKEKKEEKWVGQQIEKMLELPDILYKYVPGEILNCGFPNSLRATQPATLNDVMEGNISTLMGSKTERDQSYKMLSESLTDIFGDDALSDDELNRRKNLYGDPRVSTIIRDFLSRFVGVVSFSSDPLIPTMWAHYAQNSGFVVGYNTHVLKKLGIDLRRVLYLELAPTYTPTRDNVIRLQFVDEESRQQEAQASDKKPGIPLLGCSVDFLELRKDWKELAKVLFVKGEAWSYEKEVRMLVDLSNTRPLDRKDKNGWQVRVLNVPTEAIKEVYVGFNTPRDKVKKIKDIVGVGEGMWKLKYTDSHAYRMQVTTILDSKRTKPVTCRSSDSS